MEQCTSAAVRHTAKAFTEMVDGIKSAIYWLEDFPLWLIAWWALVVAATILAAHA